ncbi:MAG: hypothetical protein JST00_07830 [Deltaproteobacteria bacterium]|nr:hypothetical protein [Deltaproteobacteria bacterium]
MGFLWREWKRLVPYFSLLDFGDKPSTRVAWLVRIAVMSFALVVLWRRTTAATAPLLTAKPPPAVPTEEIDDYRFRLPERVRREIFIELAGAEIAERKRAIDGNTWNGHIWSREDDRGQQERMLARTLAGKYKVSLTQIYLVLDEGIRNKWPGADGEPLRATTPPLDIRTTW